MIKLNDKYCIVPHCGNAYKYQIITIADWEENKDKPWENPFGWQFAPANVKFIAGGDTIKEATQHLIQTLMINAASDKDSIEIQDLIREIDSINYFYFI